MIRAWPPLQTAGDFLVTEIRTKLDGRWAAAWRDLYPPHRLVASRLAYVTCERSTPFPAKLQSVRVLSVLRGRVAVAGLTQPVPGVAVRVRIALGWYGSRDPVVFSHTFHLVPVHGRWTWLLSNMGQTVFQPPSVAGWDWGPAWMSSNSMRARFDFANVLLDQPGLEVPDGSGDPGLASADQLGRASDAAGGPWVAPDTRAALICLADGAYRDLRASNVEGRRTRATLLQRSLRHLMLSGPDAQLH